MPTEAQERRAFGHRLKSLRKARGLSQEGLAELVEISLESVSRAERGLIFPSVPTVVRMANALDVSLDELLKGAAHQGKRHAPGVERVLRMLDGVDEEALQGLAMVLKHMQRRPSRVSGRTHS